MPTYEIFTDSAGDMPKDLAAQYNIHVMQLEVIIDDKPPILSNELNSQEFYQQLRAGANAKTSAVTPGFFEEHMRKSLEEGKDILYVGFSSGLSATYSNGVMVMKELQSEFPDRKLMYVDTLSGSVGQALLVHYAALLRDAGEGIGEVHGKVEAIRDYIHHQVTVDDLFFLKRGGRIKATAAIAGTVLQFKPIINVDVNGRLFNAKKVRGRKTSINELFNRMKANINAEGMEYVFISHSDCIKDANILKDMINEEYPSLKVIIGDIGPLIGAHVGPNSLVLCYMGNVVKGS
ncbi:MAG: DegV family protein [Lachnospiraceae bacterium]|nr:DegV family protein [Lachnospiraceae bacterium]